MIDPWLIIAGGLAIVVIVLAILVVTSGPGSDTF